MTREEFEHWLEDHKDEALDRIDGDLLPLPLWVKHFGRSLNVMVDTYSDADDDDDEDLSFEET